MSGTEHKLTRRQFIDLAAGAAAMGTLGSAAHGSAEEASTPRRRVRLLGAGSPIHEPYSALHGGAFDRAAVPGSPDPLVSYGWQSPQAGDDLQIYTLGPVAAHTDTPQAFTFSPGAYPDAFTVRGAGSIRFDFGVESAAWLEFDSPDFNGSVEMSISEYDEPAIENTGPPHPVKTLAPKRYGNTFRLELNPQLYEGVRFGWIHVRTFWKPWRVTAVRAVCQAKPTNYNGSFSCSDDLLTRIWYTGAYVVKANLCKDYFGTLLMDRGDRYSWTGDAHIAQAVALAAFGNWDFIGQNLDRTADETNDIESYSLYWVLSLADYYRYTGDRKSLEQYIPATVNKLEHALGIYADPPITFYGDDERLGATFENPNRFESKSAYRMLFVRACLEFASMMSAIGRADLSTKYGSIARTKMKALRTNPRWFSPFGIHALADTVNTGLTTVAERKSMFAQSFSDRLNRLSFSPFNEYFILQAMARMNRYDEALETVRDLWGGQIEYGATTFFEVYNPSWNQCVGRNGAVPNCQIGYTSLAHAWGGGVTAWLSREILGVKPAASGFEHVEVTPRLGGGLSWVAGRAPTPHGSVDVYFDRRSGRGEVSIPPNTTGRVGIWDAGSRIQRLVVNEAVAWDGVHGQAAGIGGITRGAEFLYLEHVQPGHYSFSFEARKPKSVRRLPLTYTTACAGEDIGTSGNWGGVYGRDGYMLFDYDGIGKDRRRLPPYVVAIRPSLSNPGTCFHAQVVAETTDPRAPAGTSTNGSVRKLGQLYTGAPVACQETMKIDIETLQDAEYRVALYFLDWERLGRREAIEVFDLNSLGRLAPVQAVEGFGDGKYLLYSLRGSVRFRVDQIRGKNAVLNAMFFDPA